MKTPFRTSFDAVHSFPGKIIAIYTVISLLCLGEILLLAYATGRLFEGSSRRLPGFLPLGMSLHFDIGLLRLIGFAGIIACIYFLIKKGFSLETGEHQMVITKHGEKKDTIEYEDIVSFRSNVLFGTFDFRLRKKTALSVHNEQGHSLSLKGVTRSIALKKILLEKVKRS